MSETIHNRAGLRLGLITLAVNSAARSLDFYQATLGFQRLRGRDIVLSSPGSTEGLLRLEEQPGVAPVGNRPRFGIYHFAVLLPERADLGALVAHLDQHGIPYGSADHLASEAVYLRDPDGITIELYADRPRSEWRKPNGDLKMATEPLDRASLLAATDRQWTGLPAGSINGHMHLYVEDLEKASSFYSTGLGLETTMRIPSALFLSAGGYHHHVGLNTWAALSAPAHENDARLLEWQIVLPAQTEVDAVASRMQAIGISAQRETNGAVSVRDPWNTLLTIQTNQLNSEKELQ